MMPEKRGKSLTQDGPRYVCASLFICAAQPQQLHSQL